MAAPKSGMLHDPVIKVRKSTDPSKPRSPKKLQSLGMPIYGIFGFASCLGLIVLILLNPTDSIDSLSPVSSSNTVNFFTFHSIPTILIFLVGMIITTLAILLISFKIRYYLVQNVLRATALICTPFAPLLLLGCFPIKLDDWTLMAFAISGVGAGALLCFWMRHLAAFTTQRQSMMCCVGTLIVSGLIVIIGSGFRLEALYVFEIVLAVLSVVISFLASTRTHKQELQLVEKPSFERLNRGRYLLKENLPSMACALVIGFCWTTQHASIPPIFVACAMVAGGGLLLLTLITSNQSPAYLLLGLAMVVYVVGLSVSILAPKELAWIGIVLLAVYASCLGVVHETNIARNAPKLFTHHTTALDLSLCLDLVALFIGNTLGLFGYGEAFSNNEITLMSRAIIVLGIAAVAITFCLFTSSPQSRHLPEWGTSNKGGFFSWLRQLQEVLLEQTVNPSPENPTSPSRPSSETQMTRTEAYNMLASCYGLSRRESEVFALIARGYNAQSVADKLCVSVNTAKTHIHSIYVKYDVHSHQELVRIIEAQVVALLSGKPIEEVIHIEV